MAIFLSNSVNALEVDAAGVNYRGMAEQKPQSSRSTAAEARAERLAAKLRENLRRRKGQARERAALDEHAGEPADNQEKQE